MLKRSVLTLATVISLIGISEAFGRDCYKPGNIPGNSQEPGGEPYPNMTVRTNQDCRMAETDMGRVFRIEKLPPPRPCPYHPDWIWVTTVTNGTGRTDVVKGWIPKSWLGKKPLLNCAQGFRFR
jgi:hypothetical protein